MQRSDTFSPVDQRRGASRKGPFLTGLLEQLQAAKEEDAVALVTAARQDAKHQEYESALVNYSRALTHVSKNAAGRKDGALTLARVLLECGDVSVASRSLEYAEVSLRDSVGHFFRCADIVERDASVHREFVEAVKLWASASATLSQSQHFDDRKSFAEATRCAFHLYDWALRLLDPSGTDASATVLGALSSLGQLASQIHCFDWALEYFERNLAIKEILGMETDSVQRHIDRVTDRIAQYQTSREAMRSARFREESERLAMDEFRERMEIRWIASKLVLRLVQSCPPPPVRATTSTTSSSTAAASGGSRLRNRPSSGDSINNFFRTGNFTGLTPQQEIDAFRADVDEGKALVKAKQLEDAQDHFTNAVELAASSFSIPLEEYRSALGSLAYVFCMRAQTENEKGSKEYRKMMMKSVPHYKKVVEMTEERIATKQSTLQEEVSLASTYLQLGVVSVSLERMETGLHYMRKARQLREKFRMDTSQEDRHLLAVEKNVRKRDAELLAHATQVAEARKQTISVDRPSFAQCVGWYNSAKSLMQQRRCDEAEPLLLQALVGFESLMGADPSIRRRPEYRMTLTGLGASYYFLGQEHGKKTTAFNVNNEQALVYYNQALQGLMQDASPDGSDDVPVASLCFHVACCYANLRRYDVAAVHFQKSRDIKVRVGLTVEDIDVNLDALTQRMQSLIDEDVIRQTAQQARQNAQQQQLAAGAAPSTHPQNGPLGAMALPALGGLSGSKQGDSGSNTTTPREMNASLTSSGNFDSPKSIRRSRGVVSFLIPSEASDTDSMENSVADIPLGTMSFDSGSMEPKLHLTGSILVEPSFGSPKQSSSPVSGLVPSLPLLPPPVSTSTASAGWRYGGASAAAVVDSPAVMMVRMQRLEELARDIAADLWIPTNRAIAFITHEERKERLELFVRLDVVKRAMIRQMQDIAFCQIAIRCTLNREEGLRRRLVADGQRQWLWFGLQFLSGAEQIGRAKIALEHRRLINLPTADYHDRVTHTQETLGRSRLMFAQRAALFEIIEQYQRDRIAVQQVVARRETIVLPKLCEAAVVSKKVLFRGAARLLLAQCRTWIVEGETIDRFSLLFSEQRQFATLVTQRGVSGASLLESTDRQVIVNRERRSRLQDLVEQFGRSRIEAMQRHLVRVNIRAPMQREALVASEAVTRRELIVRPQQSVFLSTILQPSLDVHQTFLRRHIVSQWAAVAIQQIGLPIVEKNEVLSRRKLTVGNAIQVAQMRAHAVSRLEETHREDLVLWRHKEYFTSIARPCVVEQEAKQRQQNIEHEYARIFAALQQLEHVKRRESVRDMENARRRVLLMLHEEGRLDLIFDLEKYVRQAVIYAQQLEHRSMRFLQEREHLVLREALLRRVGERLANDYRLKHVMMTIGPHAQWVLFLQVASRKIYSVESLFRQVLTNTAARNMHALRRDGLAVIATVTMRETSREETAQRFSSIYSTFLQHMESLYRSEVSHRHREIQGMIHFDHRRGLRLCVTATEVRFRESAVSECERAVGFLRCAMAQDAVTSREAEQRRIVSEQCEYEALHTIQHAVAASLLAVAEGELRCCLASNMCGERLTSLEPLVQLAHACIALSHHVALVHTVECSMRAFFANEEARERADLHERLRFFNALVQAELQQDDWRSRVVDAYFEGYDALFQMSKEAESVVYLRALEASESDARFTTCGEEGTEFLELVLEGHARGIAMLELYEAERDLLETIACLPACVAEESRSRVSLVSAILSGHIADAVHPVMLSEFTLHLRHDWARLHIEAEAESERCSIQLEFAESGQLVSLQLQEMILREHLVTDAHAGVQKLQQVCYSDHTRLFAAEAEAVCLAALQSEECTRMELYAAEGASALQVKYDAETFMIGLAESIHMTLVQQSAASDALLSEEVEAWLMIVSEHAWTLASDRYAAAAASLVSVEMEEAFRQYITTWADTEASAVLEPLHHQTVLMTDELVCRSRIATHEDHISRAFLEEAKLGIAVVQQRRLSESERLERFLRVTSVEMEEREFLSRGALEVIEWGCANQHVLTVFATSGPQRAMICEASDQHKLATVDSALTERHCMLSSRFLSCNHVCLEEMLQRLHLEVDCEADVTMKMAEWVGASTLLTLVHSELVARRQLERVNYHLDVVLPLQAAELTELTYEDSVHRSVYSVEAAQREVMFGHCFSAVEDGSRQRVVASVEAEHRMLCDLALAARRVCSEESASRTGILELYQVAMREYVDIFVMSESAARCRDIQVWTLLTLFHQQYHEGFAQQQSLQLECLDVVQEPASRTLLVRESMKAIQQLYLVSVDEEEERERQVCSRHMLDLHHLALQELTVRAEMLQDHIDTVFQIRFGPILSEVRVSRIFVEMELLGERSALEKQYVFEQFVAVQCTVVMVEFVSRLETIARIQQLAAVERKEWGKLLAAFDETLTLGAAPLRDPPQLFGPPMRSFGNRGLPRLPPLPPLGPATATPRGKAVSSGGATDGLAALDRKKSSRKHLSAIASAEECVVREALNIRPSSACCRSAAGTPRMTPRNGPLEPIAASKKIVLQPLSNAMVTFKRASMTDAAVSVLLDQVTEGIRRTLTVESYQRYVVADNAAKDFSRLCGLCFFEEFELAATLMMLQTMDELSAGLFACMMPDLGVFT